MKGKRQCNFSLPTSNSVKNAHLPNTLMWQRYSRHMACSYQFFFFIFIFLIIAPCHPNQSLRLQFSVPNVSSYFSSLLLLLTIFLSTILVCHQCYAIIVHKIIQSCNKYRTSLHLFTEEIVKLLAGLDGKSSN